MKGIDFKARQLWLDFDCAASIALCVVAGPIDDFCNWFKTWKGIKPKTKSVNKVKWLWVELTSVNKALNLE